MKHKIYEITGRMKADNESWEDFFARVNKEGGMDVKVISKLLVVIFEELEYGKNRTPERTSYESSRDTEYGISPEDGDVSDGIGLLEEEISSGLDY